MENLIVIEGAQPAAEATPPPVQTGSTEGTLRRLYDATGTMISDVVTRTNVEHPTFYRAGPIAAFFGAAACSIMAVRHGLPVSGHSAAAVVRQVSDHVSGSDAPSLASQIAGHVGSPSFELAAHTAPLADPSPSPEAPYDPLSDNDGGGTQEQGRWGERVIGVVCAVGTASLFAFGFLLGVRRDNRRGRL